MFHERGKKHLFEMSAKAKCSENGASELLNEPLLGFLLGDSLEMAENACSCSSSGDSLSSAGEDYEEVHTVDAG